MRYSDQCLRRASPMKISCGSKRRRGRPPGHDPGAGEALELGGYGRDRHGPVAAGEHVPNLGDGPPAVRQVQCLKGYQLGVFGLARDVRNGDVLETLGRKRLRDVVVVVELQRTAHVGTANRDTPVPASHGGNLW